MGAVSEGIMRLFAPAKLTTSLRIVGRRDDGYHLIDAEMVSLDFGDWLFVTDGDSTVVDFFDSQGNELHLGADDLVSAALRQIGSEASVRVEKAIAAGAGLGGGSADAAAILHWAGHADPIAAASLGADVAFCLAGGRARVQGIGELIDPLPFEARIHASHSAGDVFNA